MRYLIYRRSDISYILLKIAGKGYIRYLNQFIRYLISTEIYKVSNNDAPVISNNVSLGPGIAEA